LVCVKSLSYFQQLLVTRGPWSQRVGDRLPNLRSELINNSSVRPHLAHSRCDRPDGFIIYSSLAYCAQQLGNAIDISRFQIMSKDRLKLFTGHVSAQEVYRSDNVLRALCHRSQASK